MRSLRKQKSEKLKMPLKLVKRSGSEKKVTRKDCSSSNKKETNTKFKKNSTFKNEGFKQVPLTAKQQMILKEYKAQKNVLPLKTKFESTQVPISVKNNNQNVDRSIDEAATINTNLDIESSAVKLNSSAANETSMMGNMSYIDIREHKENSDISPPEENEISDTDISRNGECSGNININNNSNSNLADEASDLKTTGTLNTHEITKEDTTDNQLHDLESKENANDTKDVSSVSIPHRNINDNLNLVEETSDLEIARTLNDYHIAKDLTHDNQLRGLNYIGNSSHGGDGRSMDSRFSNRITNKDQYIKKKRKNGTLYYSAELIYKCNEIAGNLKMKVHGSDSLLTVNYGNFVSIIKVRNDNELDFKKSFSDIKLQFFNRITIAEVLKDDLLERRNNAYSNFKSVLKDRIAKVVDDRSCADDVLQLSFICTILTSTKPLKVLLRILENKFVSNIIKIASKDLFENEKYLHNRNKILPKFDKNFSLEIQDLFIVLRDLSEEAKLRHKQYLWSIFPSKNYNLLHQFLLLEDLPVENLLYLGKADITFFSDLDAIANQISKNSEIKKYLEELWQNFFEKVKGIKKHSSLMQQGPLLNPVFPFLFKSFIELMSKIIDKTNMSIKNLFWEDDTGWKIAKTIDWKETSLINKTYQKQYEFIFILMEHFKPGHYSNKDKYKYKFELFDPDERPYWKTLFNIGSSESIGEERLVWMYIFDCGLQAIAEEDKSEHFKKLARSLLSGFSKYLKDTHMDCYESFRVSTHNILQFAARISPYISDIDNESSASDLDHNILEKQIQFISNVLVSTDIIVLNYFSNLIEVYNEYWKNRSSIRKEISDEFKDKIIFKIKLYSVIFEDKFRDIVIKLLEIVHLAFSQTVAIQDIIYFLRFFNEFLSHLKSLEFDWLVSGTLLSEIETLPFCTLLDENKKSYKIYNPEKFIKILDTRKLLVPKHYLIEVILDLLKTIVQSLLKENWSPSQKLKASGDLFLAIGQSLPYLKGQSHYRDFDKYFKDCTLPFQNTVSSSETYPEFKNRLDKVKNFYLYTDRQDELSFNTALELCVNLSEKACEEGFTVDINSDILIECYNLYLAQFATLANTDIPTIVENIKPVVHNASSVKEWSSDFKQKSLPFLLASLAAIWTILESKDVIRIGKRIELHCVQIMCIFRLLGVDKEDVGIDNHMAQVLTGQGKSVILGLISAILAITGHKVYIVCYINYLVERDEKAFKAFFDSFTRKLLIKDRINYLTIDDLANKKIRPIINGNPENIRSLVKKLILNKLQTACVEIDSVKDNEVLLIDEVDVLTSLYQCETLRPCTTVEEPALLEIQPKIWDLISAGIYEKEIILEKMNLFINELCKDSKYKEFKNLLKSTNNFFKGQLQKMIDTAISVSKSQNVFQYKILENGVIACANSFGHYIDSVFNYYYNMFHYFRLKQSDFDHKCYSNYGYLVVDCGNVSYSILLREYSTILCVSGTLTNLNKFEKEALKSWRIHKVTEMPSFFGGCKLEFIPAKHFRIEDSVDKWMDSIYNSIDQLIHYKNPRAVIVFFDTQKEIEEFCLRYRGKINRLHVLTGNEAETTIEEYIDEAGLPQTVTVALRAKGRGVDYKSNDISVEKAGGIHVIQTCYAEDVKEETQFKGRSARKHNKGSYELILCRVHLEKLECSKTIAGNPITNYKEICQMRKAKANHSCAIKNENMKKSELKHNLTMKFIKSFHNFNPKKREEYFSNYPFVDYDEK